MKSAALHRLAWMALLLALAYALAMWAPVRDWYRDEDKLAHAVVFAGVYVALAWALRWKPWALAALAWALGAAVEVHQLFLPGFTASLTDWLADAVGIVLASGAHLAWMRWPRMPVQTALVPVVKGPFLIPVQEHNAEAPRARRYPS